MRKLASIQEVTSIEPIEGADRIELAHVLGWQCVVNKGSFKPGDLAIYFEIDSFLPIRPEFEFMRASSYKKNELMGEGFRLRTLTLRGALSQGLLLPISQFPEIPDGVGIGTDVTEILGVRKWEVEEMATSDGSVIGTLPMDVPHTDETRVQAEPDLVRDFAGLEYYISTKMDGSSHSASIDEDGFHVTGHRFEYKDDGKCYFYEMLKERSFKDKMLRYYEKNGFRLFTIQGELCGAGIQGNKLKLKKPEWYVFTVRIDGRRVGLDKMREVCTEIGLEMVPIEEVGEDLPSHYPTIESLLERADGPYPNGGKKEGIVIRPTVPVYCRILNDDLSMKVVNNRFLLKNKE